MTLSVLYSQLRRGKWPVPRSQPAGPAGQLLVGAGAAHRLPGAQPAQGVLPLPLGQRLRLVTKDDVQELLSPERAVSTNPAHLVFHHGWELCLVVAPTFHSPSARGRCSHSLPRHDSLFPIASSKCSPFLHNPVEELPKPCCELQGELPVPSCTCFSPLGSHRSRRLVNITARHEPEKQKYDRTHIYSVPLLRPLFCHELFARTE